MSMTTEINTTMNYGTATPRQRWALYCITKKDYREVVLSKEDAAKLIQELGNKDHKKPVKVKKTLEDELLDYLKAHFDSIFAEAAKSLKLQSIVETDSSITSDKDKKQYAFIGVGCGITYPKYRKCKSMDDLMNAARKFRSNEIENLFLSKFTKKEINYYHSIGCPLEAIWFQDMNMQGSYWWAVKEFCETKGKKIEIVSYLD